MRRHRYSRRRSLPPNRRQGPCDDDDVSLLDDVSPIWTTVFEEAWESYRSGNFGIGAALVDPSDGSVVCVGRNRVAEVPSVPGALAGNMTAHAEMNAFAAMDRFTAAGLHLYSTLEPCLMCAGTAIQLRVEHAHFAAVDEFYLGLDDLWPQHPLTAERQYGTTGPFDGAQAPLAEFARLLPLTFTLEQFPGRSASRIARDHHPELSRIAGATRTDAEWAAVRRDGSVEDGLAFYLERRASG